MRLVDLLVHDGAETNTSASCLLADANTGLPLGPIAPAESTPDLAIAGFCQA